MTELMETAAGTPAGDLLRRYWQPIALETQLSEARPIRPLKVLSEGLILFREAGGLVGLGQERCPHNGYPLMYGHIDGDSIACVKHGWHFNHEGTCWVVGYQDKIYPVQWANAKVYPVQSYAGLFWAYLGPLPAPPLPRYEALERDGARRFTTYPYVNRSWLELVQSATPDPASLMPPTHTQGDRVWLRLPAADEHTWEVAVDFLPGEGSEHVQASARDEAELSTKHPSVDLALREFLNREIERVAEGLDPAGAERDPSYVLAKAGRG